MWDLPRPGLEPVSPALAGRFSTTAPPEQVIFKEPVYVLPALPALGFCMNITTLSQLLLVTPLTRFAT